MKEPKIWIRTSGDNGVRVEFLVGAYGGLLEKCLLTIVLSEWNTANYRTKHIPSY